MKFDIYCDMDGVLTNFEDSAKQIRDDIFEISETELWLTISLEGESFWADMPWMDNGLKLWEYIKPHNPKILTAVPGLSKDDPLKLFANYGKQTWVEKNIGEEWIDNLILTTSKEKKKFAKHNAILIDDRKKIISAWKKEGGIGILHTSANETIKQLGDIL